MANQPRTRRRVHAIRRASDGSAFQKCNLCGVSVAVALADMHDCESKKNAKRFKGECMNRNNVKQRFQDQPRSPFRLFMESFLKSCKARHRIEVDRKGFETWRNMSKKERLPYVLRAEKVNSVYTKGLLQEVEDMAQMMRQIQLRLGSMISIMKMTLKTLMGTKASGR
ncbi:high mobility group B protein 7 isoform X2 [Rhododendron vialii]|uniref:high mobility group B protein 7 isoform X2 n=1 Tax=Rhododendron vialii TaxID=182163 RepID=UPI00265ED735|nr:high mobility group B protein 7 isoform X2 [Rhododendron vialii]